MESAASRLARRGEFIYAGADKSLKHSSWLPQLPRYCPPSELQPALLRERLQAASRPALYSFAVLSEWVLRSPPRAYQAARCTDTESPSESFGAGRAAQKPVQEKRTVRCRRRRFLKRGVGCRLRGTALPPAGRGTRNNAPYCYSFDLRSNLVNSTQVLQAQTACGNVGNARFIVRNLPRSLPRLAARSPSLPV
jgi:hypothetical protein